jgi:hypothetical protein
MPVGRRRNGAGIIEPGYRKQKPRRILVAAIETRSLPSSLAAAHRGFTFYLADPSGPVDLNPERVRGSGERSKPGGSDTDGQAKG